MKHIREAKFCASGARDWFQKYGLSWSDFIANGIAAEKLESTGDALAFRVTEIARKEADDGRRG